MYGLSEIYIGVMVANKPVLVVCLFFIYPVYDHCAMIKSVALKKINLIEDRHKLV